MADEKKMGERTKAASDFIKGDTDSAVFLGNPHIDNLMTIVIAMGAEIWSDRQRMRIVEHLLSTKGKVTSATTGARQREAVCASHQAKGVASRSSSSVVKPANSIVKTMAFQASGLSETAFSMVLTRRSRGG